METKIHVMRDSKDRFYHSVEITQGLGDVKFGFSTEDVQRYLGVPDEVETLDPKTESTVMWYYASQKLQIIFQKSDCGAAAVTDETKRITQLTTSHPKTTLGGTRIIGRTEDEVRVLLRRQGYEEFTECDEPLNALGYKSFRIDSLRTTFDFRDGLLQRVLWGATDFRRSGSTA